MSTRRGVLYGIGGLAAFLAVIGAAQDAAPKAHPQLQVEPRPAAAAPATHTVTKVITHTVARPWPPACTDLVSQVDAAMQSVISYDSSVAGSKSAMEAGALAMTGRDQAALSEARTKLNQIENDSIGPLQDLFAAQAPIKRAQAACHKALGG